MPSSTVIKQGDLMPPLVLTLLDGAARVDLTAAQWVRVRMSKKTSLPPIVDALATVHPDQSEDGGHRGEVQYNWQQGDTDVAGTYLLEVEVMWPLGPQTFPAEGYGQVKITDDLAARV